MDTYCDCQLVTKIGYRDNFSLEFSAWGPFFEAGLDLELDVDFHIADLDDLDEVELDVDLQLDFIGFFTIKSSSK